MGIDTINIPHENLNPEQREPAEEKLEQEENAFGGFSCGVFSFFGDDEYTPFASTIHWLATLREPTKMQKWYLTTIQNQMKASHTLPIQIREFSHSDPHELAELIFTANVNSPCGFSLRDTLCLILEYSYLRERNWELGDAEEKLISEIVRLCPADWDIGIDEQKAWIEDEFSYGWVTKLVRKYRDTIAY